MPKNKGKVRAQNILQPLLVGMYHPATILLLWMPDRILMQVDHPKGGLEL